MAWFQLLTLILPIKEKSAMQLSSNRMAKILLPNGIEGSATSHHYINFIASWNQKQPQDKLSLSHTYFGCSIFSMLSWTALSWFENISVTPAAFRARFRVCRPPRCPRGPAKAENAAPRESERPILWSALISLNWPVPYIPSFSACSHTFFARFRAFKQLQDLLLIDSSR